MKSLKNTMIKIIICALGFVGLFFCFFKLFEALGFYPMGYETYYHLYRSDFLYRAMTEDKNWFPVLSLALNQGVKLFQNEAPLVAYVMAIFQLIFSGNMVQSYIGFLSLLLLLGLCVWLYMGVKLQRPVLGLVVGLVWVTLPNNLHLLFYQGDMAKALLLMLLPLLFYHMQTYFQEEGVKHLAYVSVLGAVFIFIDAYSFLQVLLLAMVYLVAYAIAHSKYLLALHNGVALAVSIGIGAVWFIPAKILDGNREENMHLYFQKLTTGLNPILRLEGDTASLYLGIAVILLALTGAILSRKKTRMGFGLAFLCLLFTAEGIYPVLKIMPGKELLYMTEYISLATAIVLYEWLEWKTLKKWLVVVFALLLFVDNAPSVYTIYQMNLEEKALDTSNALVDYCKEITKQRLCYMDLNIEDTSYTYLLTTGEHPISITGGKTWEESSASENIKQLYRAYEQGQYLYLFDRCRELGNDTVLIRLPENENIKEKMEYDAMRCNFFLKLVSDGFGVFHIEDVASNFGVSSCYRAIGIGSGSGQVALDFPVFEETSDIYLDHYDLDELKKYDILYLSGFYYENREKAEAMVVELSESGTHVVIAADGIPEDRVSHNQSFLGVVCNDITFSQGYPLLDTIDGELDTDLFPEGYETFRTVYVDGLDQVWGRLLESDYDVSFLGTVKNDNIVIVGLNLSYFYGLTGDKSVGALLSHTMDMDSSELPERKLVELDMKADSRGMGLYTKEKVNTGLAYDNCFEIEGNYEVENNLLVVEAGETHISYHDRNIGRDIFISILSIVVWAVFLYFVSKRKA